MEKIKYTVELKRRTPDEAAKYIIGKYLSGEITLLMFQLLINYIELEHTNNTSTSSNNIE